MKPNNVTRFLDARKVPYEAFELPEEKVGALDAARLMSVPPEQVFKTIVVKRQGVGKPILALVPGPREVDLKALARYLGEKKVALPTERQAEELTGLQAGGISPLALINRGFQIIIDETANSYEDIYVSGGQRGLDICLPLHSLASLTKATFAHISK